jgi:CBS domain-containing protein
MVITVRDLMTPDPVTVEPGDTLRFAAGVLTALGAGGAPVLKENRVVGVLTMTDILDFAANHPSAPTPRPVPVGREAASADVSSAMAVPESAEWDVLDEHTVAEVMSLRVLALAPGADVREAARLMESEGTHRVVVMEGPGLVGILTAWDLVRAIARGDFIVQGSDRPGPPTTGRT